MRGSARGATAPLSSGTPPNGCWRGRADAVRDVDRQRHRDATNAPSVVRSFDALGRETVQGGSRSNISTDHRARLSVGAEMRDNGDRQTLVFDGSYVAQKVGGAMIYGGYITPLVGPGLGFGAVAVEQCASDSADRHRARRDKMRFNPFYPGWGRGRRSFSSGCSTTSRIAATRSIAACASPSIRCRASRSGSRAPTEIAARTSLRAAADYFDLQNDNHAANHTNDEGLIDVKYSTMIGNYPIEAYMQLMNEDSSPITHSDTSHLVGASLWVPAGASPLRLTAEYADSVPTVDIFSFGEVAHGYAYNNGGYPDGMRIAGETLGLSLDSDRGCLPLQAAGATAANGSYTISYHHADVFTPEQHSLGQYGHDRAGDDQHGRSARPSRSTVPDRSGRPRAGRPAAPRSRLQGRRRSVDHLYALIA